MNNKIYSRYKLQIHVMSETNAAKLLCNLFDFSKVWEHKDSLLYRCL
ncbi:MAG: hypothetical protein ACTS7E_04090 [Arsenophonus sp. NC-CH8-MAG3]